MKLTALWSPEQQFQHKNGAILTNGKIYVYLAGRTELAQIYVDDDGIHQSQNPVILDDNGRAVVYADEAYSYTAVVCDYYGQELFSFEPVGLGGAGSDAQVSTEITSETLDVEKTFDPHTNTNTFDIELKDKDIDHWIGQHGAPIQISGDSQEAALPLPDTNHRDYIGSFIDRIEDGKYMYLKPGLYQVDCVIRFTQSDEDLQNELGQVLVYTGNGNAEETGAWQLDGAGPYANDNRHTLHASFVRKVLDEGQTSNVDCSNLLYFAPGTPFTWSEAFIQRLSVVRLDSISTGSAGGSGSGQIVIDDKPISRIQVTSNTLDGTDWAGTSWKYALTEVVGDKLTWRQDGEDMNLGNVYAKAGTYHYDFTVRVDWIGELRKEIVRFQILGINPNDRDTWHSFDLSYPHTEFYHFSSFSNRMAGWEDRIFVDLDISPYDRAPAGLTATVETLTIFSIEDSVSVHTGLDKVHHDETMTGDGTSSNPLSISEEVSDLQDQIDGKQDELTPGTGISIINNVISCSAQGGGGGPTYTAGQYIDITPENVINVSGLQPAGDYQPAGNYLTPEDLEGYATTEDVEEATSGKLDTSAYVAPVQSDWNQNDPDALDFIKNKPTIPSLDGYATEEYVVEQTSGKMDSSAYVEPVQSDWNDTDPDHLSYIKNKPTECGLIAGQNVWFEDLSSGLRINCSGTGGSGVTEEYVQEAVASGTSGKLNISDYTAPVQSDWNQSDREALDFIKNKPTIPSLDGYATQEYVVQETSGKLDASAYEAPVQSDWNQANASMLDYIKNKPESSQLLAGPGISITESGNDYMISSTGGGGSDVTKEYVDETVQSATSGKLDTSAYTAPVQSDWTEPDAEALSFIKNKPTECSLIAGENVWIEDTTSGVKINCSAQGGGGGGSTYEAGQYIDITNDVISVPNTSASNMIAGDGINIVESGGNTTIMLGLTAGITDAELVNELPAQPTATVLYMIPET